MTQLAPLSEVLQALDRLLDEETEALVCLDHETLDSITDRKVQLLARLAEAERGADLSSVQEMVLSIRRRALNNRVLMVHARDMTRGVFQVLTGGDQGKSQEQGRLLRARG